MAKIQYLKDSEGSIVFPVTHESAVKDRNGVLLEDKLMTQDEINQETGAALAGKQATLVSGENIKTINGSSILGSGDLTVGGSKIDAVTVSVDSASGNPSGSGSVYGGILSLSFSGLVGATGATGATGAAGSQGEKGDDGDSAGFGTAIATVEDTSGDPGCQVVLSGPNTAKNMAFVFSGIVGRKGEKGNKGDTGEKGDTGAQGPLGPPGISSPVYASVSETTGIPNVTTTLSNTTLSLAFSGLKGEQGNPGSSQDYPFELVNNLIDGGTSKALTAEQGKHLYDNCLLLGAVVANNVSIGD